MICINGLTQMKSESRESGSAFVRLLAPFAPHIAEELWIRLGHETSVHVAEWPGFNPAYLVEDEKTYPVSINGKNRGSVTVSASASKDEVEKAALELDSVQKWLEGKPIKKVIVVPGRIVNIVV
jgi:leucyl-tRNA synthetase